LSPALGNLGGTPVFILSVDVEGKKRKNGTAGRVHKEKRLANATAQKKEGNRFALNETTLAVPRKTHAKKEREIVLLRSTKRVLIFGPGRRVTQKFKHQKSAIFAQRQGKKEK